MFKVTKAPEDAENSVVYTDVVNEGAIFNPLGVVYQPAKF